MYKLKSWILCGTYVVTFLLVLAHIYFAYISAQNGNPNSILTLPLAVILPALALFFLGSLQKMKSEEGVLMQVGTMLHILLILILPDFALYLALGFPVVFLVVELFETRVPERIRIAIKRRLIA